MAAMAPAKSPALSCWLGIEPTMTFAAVILPVTLPLEDRRLFIIKGHWLDRGKPYAVSTLLSLHSYVLPPKLDSRQKGETSICPAFSKCPRFRLLLRKSSHGRNNSPK